jgi:hypothetical protein
MSPEKTPQSNGNHHQLWTGPLGLKLDNGLRERPRPLMAVCSPIALCPPRQNGRTIYILYVTDLTHFVFCAVYVVVSYVMQLLRTGGSSK